MKILVISNYRGYHTARPEAEIFIGLQKLGHDITIMTYPDAEYISRFRENGIKVILEHPNSKSDQKFIAIAQKELKDGKYDILHLFNNKAIRNGIKAASNIDVKVIIYRGASANMAWYNPVNHLKFYHHRVDYVICNSEEIKKKFSSVPFYDYSKAITILKGHDIDWYSDIDEHDIRTELGIKKDSILFVTVANNRRVKGISILLKAIKNIPSDTNIDLIIIGKKMDRPPIPRLTEESGNMAKIHFLGFRKDALNIVKACDVFVCPSIGSEALTKSVIEAMCLGVVPLISDISGNKPLVVNEIDGMTFKNKDSKKLAEKMMFLYHNPGLLTNLSTKAKQKINREINNENTVLQYDDFYKRLKTDSENKC